MSKTTDAPEQTGQPANPPSGVATLRSLYNALRDPNPTARPHPPTTSTDAADRDIRYRVFDANATEALVELYDAFEYRDRSQGLPPAHSDAIRDWLDTVQDSLAVVALHQDAIVGHAVFVPDGDGHHELASFVHPDYHHAGIGTDLIETGLGYADTAGVKDVWLTVEARNDDLLARYQDVGFTVEDARGPIHQLSIEL